MLEVLSKWGSLVDQGVLGRPVWHQEGVFSTVVGRPGRGPQGPQGQASVTATQGDFPVGRLSQPHRLPAPWPE